MTPDPIEPAVPEEVDAAAAELGVDVESVEPIRAHIFAVTTDGADMIVKAPEPPRPGARLFGVYSNVTQAWESAVLRAHEEKGGMTDGTPKLLAELEDGTLVLEHLGDGPRPKDAELEEQMRLLVQFQTAPVAPRVSPRHLPAWTVLKTRAGALLRSRLPAVARHAGRSVAFDCARLLLRLAARQPRLPFLFHSHGDWGRHNMVRDGDGNLRLLDFADVIRERRWILYDASTGAIHQRTARFSPEPLVAYLHAVEAVLKQRGVRVDVPLQLRACLLLVAIRIFYTYDHGWRQLELPRTDRFLKEHILSDSGYAAWYRTHAQAVDEAAVHTGQTPWAGTRAVAARHHSLGLDP